MVKLSLFLFSTDILIIQQKCGSRLYFHLKTASRMLHSIVASCAQGLLPWSSYHLPSWDRETLQYLGKSCLERKMEVRKPLQLPESISLTEVHVCGIWGGAAAWDCASPPPEIKALIISIIAKRNWRRYSHKDSGMWVRTQHGPQGTFWPHLWTPEGSGLRRKQ